MILAAVNAITRSINLMGVIKWWYSKKKKVLHYLTWDIWFSFIHKNTFDVQTVQACVLSHIWLCDPMDCSPPGSSVHGISQAKIVEQVAISFSSGSSWFRDRTQFFCVSCISGWVLYHWATWEDPPALGCKFLYNLTPPHNSWEQFSQGYLRCCLLGLKS